MKNVKTVCALIATLTINGSLIGGANAATIATARAFNVSAPLNYVDTTQSTVGVGFGGPRFDILLTARALVIFRVSNILANEGLAVNDLQTVQFSLSFDASTVSGTPIGNGMGSYKADYLGFFANGDFPSDAILMGNDRKDWLTAVNAYDIGEEVDSNIAANASGQSIAISSFTMGGVIDDGDLSNDFVAFGLRYDELAEFVNQPSPTLDNFQLNVVPEPSSSVLMCLGATALVLRKRRG